jgi:RHS repeat-associated protein
METAASPVENALFSNIDLTRTAIAGITPAYPTDNTTNPNAYVAKTNASSGGQKIGPSLVLRVMAGDTIQINATGVYNSTAANTSITTQPDMVSAILNAFSGSGISDGVHGAFGVGSAISTGLTTGVFNSLKQIDTSQNLSTKPKAYLNFALFDDQFALVSDNSGVRQIQGSPNVLQLLSVGRMVIKKTGFLYIYTNNESGSDVFFDNLVVVHNGGPVLEETHYYPFGLTMAGISNHALKGLSYPENRYKYNGIEKIEDLGLEDYDAQFRELDPQLGRWWEVDPRSDNMEMWSPYVSNYDNPINYNDYLGDEPDGGPGLLERLGNAVKATGQQVLSAAAGATNAYVSNNLLGGGRIDASRTGLIGGNAIAYQVGQKIGDATAIYTGVLEDAAAGVGDFFTLGGATVVAVPLALHGTTTAVLGVENLLSPIKNVEETPSNTKANGKYTEPKLPPKTVAEEGNIKAEHYTRSGDHGPPHIHVKGGGKETKVGQNGKPISGAPELTAAQQEFVNNFKAQIRNAVDKIGKWYNYNSK